MKEKKKEKSRTEKRRVLRVPGGRPLPAAKTEENAGGEEVTAGFKAGKDIEA